MLIVRTAETDVWRNLAVEEYLLDRAGASGVVLFLWRNAPALVFGKNQNPWQEFSVGRARAAGVALARRCSGGGAVYHDEGNLNFSLILPRARYDLPRQFGVVLAAVRALGVAAEQSGRSSLTAGGRKFSGHAFCLRGTGALHHGTLLLHSDLARLRALLAPPGARIESHAVRSVPAAVINLCELVPGLDADRAGAALARAAEREYGGGEPLVEAGDAEIAGWDWGPIRARLAAPEWIFGHTPPFELTVPDQGGGTLRLRVEQGIVRAAEICPPAADGTRAPADGDTGLRAPASRRLRSELRRARPRPATTGASAVAEVADPGREHPATGGRFDSPRPAPTALPCAAAAALIGKRLDMSKVWKKDV